MVDLHKLDSLVRLSAAVSDGPPAATIQPATEFGALQIPVLSLCTASLANSQKVVDDKDAQFS